MALQGQIPTQDLFLRLSGSGDGPWEIAQVQPVIIKLVEQGIFGGEVLDVGCGIGDNVVYIASQANNVHLTAIDLSPNAVEVAQEKAKKNNVNIQFEVIDMLKDLSTTNLKKNFYDIILDVAVFHVFSDEDRPHYIKNLENLIKPNGLYIQVCYSEKETRPGGPRRITKSDLNKLFSSENGWRIESIEDAIYQAKPDAPLGEDGRAYLSFIRRHKIDNN